MMRSGDQWLPEQDLIERFIGRMKPYRRIFSRFEKLNFAATLSEIKQNVNTT